MNVHNEMTQQRVQQLSEQISQRQTKHFKLRETFSRFPDLQAQAEQITSLPNKMFVWGLEEGAVQGKFISHFTTHVKRVYKLSKCEAK